MHEKNIDLNEIKKLIVHPKIGEMLLQHRKINIHQLADSLEEQKTNKLPIGRILIDKSFITENELVELLSLQNNIDKLLEDSYNELEQLNGDSKKD